MKFCRHQQAKSGRLMLSIAKHAWALLREALILVLHVNNHHHYTLSCIRHYSLGCINRPLLLHCCPVQGCCRAKSMYQTH